jgi:hypothetical protein
MKLLPLLLAWPGLALALPDPTQPPAALRAPQAASEAAGVAAAPSRPVLQGLRPGPRPSALINGQLLQPGQRLAGYTLLRIDADAAVLRDADGRQHRILLLPTPDDKNNNTRKEARP